MSDHHNNKHNLLIIGIGEAGSNITLDIIKKINSEYLLINTKKNSKYITKNIMIDTPSWINPPVEKIREFFLQELDNVYEIVNNYSKIILIGNLASKIGIAIIPILAKYLSSNNREIFTFVIMPFGFEKNKIFHSGVSLSFINNYSNSTIIVDNESFLKNNPEISIPECFRITNNSIKDIIITSYRKGFPDDLNVISTCKESFKIDEAFAKSFAMSKISDSEEIEKTFLYIYPANEKIDKIESIIKTVEKIREETDYEINIIPSNNSFTKIHLVNKTNNIILFSAYDPLNQFISAENYLDFEPETNQIIKEISHLKNIEMIAINQK